MNKPRVVITHHALSGPGHTVQDVDQWHRERWPHFKSRRGRFVGYHYVIEQNGAVTKTRNHDEVGAHTIGMNGSSIGVCFMGNFNQGKPTKAQMQSWRKLYRKLRGEYPGIPTEPHRAYANRTCHGTTLSDDYFTEDYQYRTLVLQFLKVASRFISLLTKKQSIHEKSKKST